MDSPKIAGSTATRSWARRKRQVRVHKKRFPLKWLLAILVISAVVSLLLISLQGLFSAPVTDDRAYRPKDIEGRYHELQRMKHSVEKAAGDARDGR